MATKKEFAKLSQSELEDVVKKNPLVRLEDVAEALKLIRELHSMGITGSSYNVRSPYSPSSMHSTGDTWDRGSVEDNDTC